MVSCICTIIFHLIVLLRFVKIFWLLTLALCCWNVCCWKAFCGWNVCWISDLIILWLKMDLTAMLSSYPHICAHLGWFIWLGLFWCCLCWILSRSWGGRVYCINSYRLGWLLKKILAVYLLLFIDIYLSVDCTNLLHAFFQLISFILSSNSWEHWWNLWSECAVWRVWWGGM